MFMSPPISAIVLYRPVHSQRWRREKRDVNNEFAAEAEYVLEWGWARQQGYSWRAKVPTIRLVQLPDDKGVYK